MQSYRKEEYVYMYMLHKIKIVKYYIIISTVLITYSTLLLYIIYLPFNLQVYTHDRNNT